MVLSLTLVICSCDSGVGGNEGNENNGNENNGDENIIGCTLLEFTSNGDGSCIVSLDSLRNRTLMHCPNLKNVYVSEDHLYRARGNQGYIQQHLLELQLA